MKSFLAAAILISLTPAIADTIYIGTNTGGNSESKGIYRAEFDTATGKITDIQLAAEYRSPGFLTQHPTLPVLYASGGGGTVAAFKIADDGSLNFLKELDSGGKGACHIAIDATGSTLAVANYSGGNYATIAVDADGVPTKITSLIQQTGSGPNPQRQKAPHAHGVYFNPANNQLLIPDLGVDQVFVHPFNAENSTLGDALPSIVSNPGAGPRHLAFAPDNQHLYVINELDNTITTVQITDNSYQSIQTIPTLPEEFKEQNTTAEVEVHPNGKFAYSSNRGHESITVYQRDPQSGRLTVIQHAPCGGVQPRHFKISPDGKWLVCGHQASNTISMLAIDPTSGKLGEPTNTVSTPTPICILFAR